VKSSKQRSRERQQIAKTDALASWQAARQEKLANAVSKAMGLFSKLMNDTDSAVTGTVLTKVSHVSAMSHVSMFCFISPLFCSVGRRRCNQ